VEPGQKLRLDIIRIMGDGRGVSYAENGKMVLIEGANDQDKQVEVVIQNVFEETIIAKKVSRLKAEERKRSDLVDSPYQIDDEDDEDEEDD